MSNVDRSDAMARLEKVFTESKENNEGAGIPDIVEAVLGDDADEEIAELVLMAMEDSGTISSEEILDGILKLHEWRLNQT
ncbi:MAG: hypothetical protein QF911_06640 [Candidatus Thalassarchaeaceae archaeon]|nr:hypothetical protein [Candidatus Thalassarchaeaceae archaeon]